MVGWMVKEMGWDRWVVAVQSVTTCAGKQGMKDVTNAVCAVARG